MSNLGRRVVSVVLPFAALPLAASMPAIAVAQETTAARGEVPVLGRKPLVDYFKPTPIIKPLSRDVWGAATVGPRDTGNGLEDATMKRWNYWDGQILKGPDGKYRLFASRWDQATGHEAWVNSLAVEAVSDSLYGPYTDRGLMWPTDQGGKGHNVTALRLRDGRYAVMISETRNGDIYTSKSIDGPWRKLGDIVVDQSAFKSVFTPAELQKDAVMKPWHGSNLSIMARPDGGFAIIQRSGQILISPTDILGPYKVMGDSIYRGLAGLPQTGMDAYEDPVIWHSGGWYHVVVNHWRDRRAFHLISRDGITGWKVQGLAYEPGAKFIRYTNGLVNHWNKLERPGVVIENGHVVAISFAVIDVPKEQQKGDDGHGSKIVVVPFDGAAMDRDLKDIDKAGAR
jgi:hypothetical protein